MESKLSLDTIFSGYVIGKICLRLKRCQIVATGVAWRAAQLDQKVFFRGLILAHFKKTLQWTRRFDSLCGTRRQLSVKLIALGNGDISAVKALDIV